ncbi:MAG: DUF6883 domain-containing protein [bacterium]
MKIPNKDRAVVDIDKLRNYCLNFEHPRGKHKARVFASILGLIADDAEELQKTLLNIVRTHEAFATHQDQYGIRYVIDFTMKKSKQQARVRSSWIIREGEDFPRLTSCYILKTEG